MPCRELHKRTRKLAPDSEREPLCKEEECIRQSGSDRLRGDWTHWRMIVSHRLEFLFHTTAFPKAGDQPMRADGMSPPPNTMEWWRCARIADCCDVGLGRVHRAVRLVKQRRQESRGSRQDLSVNIGSPIGSPGPFMFLLLLVAFSLPRSFTRTTSQSISRREV